MDDGAQSVIQTRGLGKSYGSYQALKSLDLTVARNSIFGFLGPNGAGKTTTIKLLLGLSAPTSGAATVFGMDIRAQSIDIRARVGYLPQEPRFYEHMTARETLDYTARFFFRGPGKAIADRVAQTLDLVGLSDKADRPIRGFSGGERQRLGIAQAQVNYPDLLILDEPAASLDPLGRRDVLEVMARLRKHATVFYSTHILDDVQRVSDTVAILNRGELVASGPIQALLAGPGEAVFSVSIDGQIETAKATLMATGWVSRIEDGPPRGTGKTLSITVTDETAALRDLLRLLLAEQELRVLDFRRHEHRLEDVFMQIVEGNADGR